MSKHKHFTKLIDLVNELNKEWDYEFLSENRNIYMEDIENDKLNNNLEPFQKTSISNNQNVNIEFILKYPNTIEDYKNEDDYKYHGSIYSNGLFWDWESLSNKLGFPVVRKYPNLPWNYRLIDASTINDWEYVFENPIYHYVENICKYIPLKYILHFLQICPSYDVKMLSENSNLSVQFIKQNPEIKWDFIILSKNLPLSEIQKDLSLPWNYESLSENETLTTEFILQHLDQDWKDDLLEDDQNIDLRRLEMTERFKFPNALRLLLDNSIRSDSDNKLEFKIDTDFKKLSYDKNLKIDQVLANKNKDWNLYLLSANPAFSLQDIIKGINNGFDWDFQGLSANPNITFDFVYQYRSKKWDYTTLSCNKFDYEYKKFLISNKLKRKYIIRKNKKIAKIFKIYLIKELINLFFEY